MSARLMAPAAILVALLGSVACSSSSGASAAPAAAPASTTAAATTTTTDPGLDPTKVEQTVRDAVQAASAAHMKGTVAAKGQTVGLDLQLNSDTASGTITANGVTVPVVLVNKVYYVRFTADLLKAGGVPPTSPAAAKLLDKWVPSTSPALNPGVLNEVQSFLNYHEFMSHAFTVDAHKIVALGSDTIDGIQVLKYQDQTSSSTVYVTAASPHYPLRVVTGGGQGPTGTINFTGWDKPVAVTAPPKSETFGG